MDIKTEDFLVQQEHALRKQLKAIQSELQKVEAARQAIRKVEARKDKENSLRAEQREVIHLRAKKPETNMTIKAMVFELLKGLPEGASAEELIERIAEDYKTEVPRTSISPQLSRMKDDGVLRRTENGIWLLIPGSGARITTSPSGQRLLTRKRVSSRSTKSKE
jgi:hypothetical protein